MGLKMKKEKEGERGREEEEEQVMELMRVEWLNEEDGLELALKKLKERHLASCPSPQR